MASNHATHGDLLEQVASSTHERDEVRRILGLAARNAIDTAISGPVPLGLDSLKLRKRPAEAQIDPAPSWLLPAYLGAVIGVCVGVPLLMHIVPRVVAWLEMLP